MKKPFLIGIGVLVAALLVAAYFIIQPPEVLVYTTPVPEQTNFYAEKGQALKRKLNELEAAFSPLLSTQDQFIAFSFRDALDDLSDDVDWQGFEAAMENCKSAFDFAKLLNTDFVGINQAPAGEPQRQSFLSVTQAVLTDSGHDDMPYRSFVKAHGDSTSTPHFYAYAGGDSLPNASQMPMVRIGLSQEGRVTEILYNRAGAQMAPIMGAERDAAGEFALAFALAHVDLRDEPREMKISDYVYASDIENPLAKVWIYHLDDTSRYTANKTGGEAERVGCSMEIDVVTGQIISLNAFTTERSFDADAPESSVWASANEAT